MNTAAFGILGFRYQDQLCIETTLSFRGGGGVNSNK